MTLCKRTIRVLLVSLLCVPALALADDPPLTNWKAPATFTPQQRPGVHALGVESEIGIGPSPFFPITPCRQYDSRPAHGGNGALVQGTPQTIPVTGSPCGIPAGTRAASVNITVFDIAGATGNGVFKVDVASPPAIAWINYPSNETQRSNAGAVSLDGSGQLVVAVAQGAGSVDFTIDVNGYYLYNTTSMPPQDYFALRGTYDSGGILIAQQESSASGSSALLGFLDGSGDGSAAAEGVAESGSGRTYGVLGSTRSSTLGAAGVYGVDSSGDPGSAETKKTAGVYGASQTGYGVFGASRYVGVKGAFLDSAGNSMAVGYLGESINNAVTGLSFNTVGTNYGVYGSIVATTTSDSAGVYGVAGVFPHHFTYNSVGVRGDGAIVGVLGNSPEGFNDAGLYGATFDSAGNPSTLGLVGWKPSAGGTYGLYAYTGTIACNGCTKMFVEPHPTDASEVIRFVSIEGNEAGIQTRGSGQTVGGRAVIEVPEEFRMVAEPDGLTVQLTPVGELATMAVQRKSLQQIVVLSSKDVPFDYLIQGVHHGYREFASIVKGGEYIPHSPDVRMPASWSEPVKRALIANGTYNADGTVNMETAERLGWAQAWRDQAAKALETATVRAPR